MRLFIFGDQLLFSEALASLLEQRNHTVIDCHFDPVEFLRTMNAPEIDVCLMDIRSSGTEAIDLVAKVRIENKALAIVVLTDDVDVHILREFIDVGANAICVRSDGIEEIEEILKASREVVARRQAPIWSRGARALARRSVEPTRAIKLTPKEQAILDRLVRGASTERIASELNVGSATVRTHLQHLFTKFGVHSRLALVASAVRLEAVAIDDDSIASDVG